MNDITFFETQIKSKMSVAKILRNTKIKVDIYFSKYEVNKDTLVYVKTSANFRRVQKAKMLEKVSEGLIEIADKNNLEIKL